MAAVASSTRTDTTLYLAPSVEPFPKVFHRVDRSTPDRMAEITEIFNRILEPLYGSQRKALEQISRSEDRVAYLMYIGEDPVGVLVFKTSPSDEFNDLGVTKSIEVKSLFLDSAGKNSGKGLGSALVDKLKTEVENLHSGHNSIHVTVSEDKTDSLAFFAKKGFQIVHEWKDRYIKGKTEFLLSCPARIAESERRINALSERFACIMQRAITHVPTGETPELVNIIHDAHTDDIHDLVTLSDGTFVSGSKDNCIYKWDQNGRLIRIVDEVEPHLQSDRNWVTSIKRINDLYFVSGDRAGHTTLWSTNGDYVRNLDLQLPKKRGHVSNPKNRQRANCYAAGTNPHNPTLFAGYPTSFSEYNFFHGGTVSSTKVHNNDWVYSFTPVSEDRLFTVIGDVIEVWSKTHGRWHYSDQLVAAGPRSRVAGSPSSKPKMTRAFISDIEKLDGESDFYGLAVFNGRVQVLDAERKELIRNYREHTGRVWKIESLREHVFASSGEDRSIKIWDVRQDRSVHTINDHVGQVTSLAKLTQDILIAGTCPADPSTGSAEVRFYDIRK